MSKPSGAEYKIQQTYTILINYQLSIQHIGRVETVCRLVFMKQFKKDSSSWNSFLKRCLFNYLLEYKINHFNLVEEERQVLQLTSILRPSFFIKVDVSCLLVRPFGIFEEVQTNLESYSKSRCWSRSRLVVSLSMIVSCNFYYNGKKQRNNIGIHFDYALHFFNFICSPTNLSHRSEF